MNKKRRIVLTAEEARQKARRQIIAVLAAGAVLLIADLAVSAKPSVNVTEEDGRLYMIRPLTAEEPAYLTLRAKISGENETVEKKIDVMLEPYGEKAEENEKKQQEKSESSTAEREQLEYELRRITSGFNDDTEMKEIALPAALDSGEKISWEIEKSSGTNVPVISALTMVVAFCIYKNRFAAMEKQQKENRESVIRQLPEFVNRLVLLLNAGLVLTVAFERSIEEGLGFKSNEKDYFYGKLKEIYMSSQTTNASLNLEFRRMAKASGIRELMRVSNIINDNINKGVELTGKLQAESEILWLNRKKACEEKGRLAETKLTLPLMIFLMVLIMITVAPALLEL